MQTLKWHPLKTGHVFLQMFPHFYLHLAGKKKKVRLDFSSSHQAVMMPVGKLDSGKELDTDKNTTEDERLITATIKEDGNAITIHLSTH